MPPALSKTPSAALIAYARISAAVNGAQSRGQLTCSMTQAAICGTLGRSDLAAVGFIADMQCLVLQFNPEKHVDEALKVVKTLV